MQQNSKELEGQIVQMLRPDIQNLGQTNLNIAGHIPIFFKIKWKSNNNLHEKQKITFVQSGFAKMKFPLLVIKYYESKMLIQPLNSQQKLNYQNQSTSNPLGQKSEESQLCYTKKQHQPPICFPQKHNQQVNKCQHLICDYDGIMKNTIHDEAFLQKSKMRRIAILALNSPQPNKLSQQSNMLSCMETLKEKQTGRKIRQTNLASKHVVKKENSPPKAQLENNLQDNLFKRKRGCSNKMDYFEIINQGNDKYNQLNGSRIRDSFELNKSSDNSLSVQNQRRRPRKLRKRNDNKSNSVSSRKRLLRKRN